MSHLGSILADPHRGSPTSENPLLELLPSCRSCGQPVIVLCYGLDHGFQVDDPRYWATVDRGPVIEPIAGGIHAADVCTSCGRIGDLQTERAIVWNVGAGSPVPKLVPPHPRPVAAVHAAAGWEDDGAIDLYHLIALRGRWADDVRLEAAAIEKLLDAERRIQIDVYTSELRARAHVLLEDDRLEWIDRVGLHAELGRDATFADPPAGYRHLRAALELARDEREMQRFLVSDPDASWSYPDVPWLAIDTAEAAVLAACDAEALALLRWAVPACGERDVAHGGAVMGADLAEASGDHDFEVDCRLILLEDQCLVWRDLDEHDPVAAVWQRFDELLMLDPSGVRRARVTGVVEAWTDTAGKRALLDRLCA